MIKFKDINKYIVIRNYTTECGETYITTIGHFDNEENANAFKKMMEEEHDRCMEELENANNMTGEEECEEARKLIKNKYFPESTFDFDHLNCYFSFYVNVSKEIDMSKEIAIYLLTKE